MRSTGGGTFVTMVGSSALAIFLFGVSTLAQSTLPDHPTPITQNEVAGTIKARDIGDARLTTHYYWFEGAQGDVFINWTSRNFAGDVDLFIQNGLRSLTKIVVYADFGEVETGRVIYLRKRERLLLRVQGRTPNDDAATYRLKFAGSFVAGTPNENDVPALPSVGENVTGSVRVNSVGTILPPLPKPVEAKTYESTSANVASDSEKKAQEKMEAEMRTEESNAGAEENKETSKMEVVVEDKVKKADLPKASAANRPRRRTRPAKIAPVSQKEAKAEKVTGTAANPPNIETSPEKSETEKETPMRRADKASTGMEAAIITPKATLNVDPLANVRLVIVFKDGRKIERPLPEVFRFSVDRGVLTVVSKDGRVGKYQMVDVSKVTIE